MTATRIPRDRRHDIRPLFQRRHLYDDRLRRFVVADGLAAGGRGRGTDGHPDVRVDDRIFFRSRQPGARNENTRSHADIMKTLVTELRRDGPLVGAFTYRADMRRRRGVAYFVADPEWPRVTQSFVRV